MTSSYSIVFNRPHRKTEPRTGWASAQYSVVLLAAAASRVLCLLDALLCVSAECRAQVHSSLFGQSYASARPLANNASRRHSGRTNVVIELSSVHPAVRPSVRLSHLRDSLSAYLEFITRLSLIDIHDVHATLKHRLLC
ncbi:unnamed protein product [Angiostrongylus costaricensis]|uniref:Secreted protein n=1 Tax=Angiostrongylus costaricensis TaxID=334426 RepID=A0A0R3Q1U3_ANGCS|nr:unnamed protein product [Angiostrongylus costaricensis]